MPTVSVIIPAFNQAAFLGPCLRSALAQTQVDLEVIVVDDGSTDATPEVVQGFTDRRVRYFRQENRGLSAARNTGIRNSAGEFVSLLDSDDLMLPEKHELLLTAMGGSGEVGIAAGQAIPVDDSGRRVGRAFTEPLPQDPVRLLLGNPLHVGSVLVRRPWFERVGPFDETLRSYEDWDMWLRLGLAGCRSVWVDRPVSCYRFHRSQMTRDGSRMTEASFAVLAKVFARSDLPTAWATMRGAAFSRAHLRGAAQAFLNGRYQDAGSHLESAIEMNPALNENGGRPLMDSFQAWLDLPKVVEPLALLERIYGNLPSRLSSLAREKRHQCAEAAVRFAATCRDNGEIGRAIRYLLTAVAFRPILLANRGFIRMIMSCLTRRP